MGQSSHGRGVAPLDGTGLNVGVVVGAGKPFSNGPDEKLHRAVSESWDEASSHGSLSSSSCREDNIKAGNKIPNDSKQISTRGIIIY